METSHLLISKIIDIKVATLSFRNQLLQPALLECVIIQCILALVTILEIFEVASVQLIHVIQRRPLLLPRASGLFWSLLLDVEMLDAIFTMIAVASQAAA